MAQKMHSNQQMTMSLLLLSNLYSQTQTEQAFKMLKAVFEGHLDFLHGNLKSAADLVASRLTEFREDRSGQ